MKEWKSVSEFVPPPSVIYTYPYTLVNLRVLMWGNLTRNGYVINRRATLRTNYTITEIANLLKFGGPFSLFRGLEIQLVRSSLLKYLDRNIEERLNTGNRRRVCRSLRVLWKWLNACISHTIVYPLLVIGNRMAVWGYSHSAPCPSLLEVVFGLNVKWGLHSTIINNNNNIIKTRNYIPKEFYEASNRLKRELVFDLFTGLVPYLGVLLIEEITSSLVDKYIRRWKTTEKETIILRLCGSALGVIIAQPLCTLSIMQRSSIPISRSILFDLPVRRSETEILSGINWTLYFIQIGVIGAFTCLSGCIVHDNHIDKEDTLNSRNRRDTSINSEPVNSKK